MKAQHEIVEKQLLQLILENQAACDDELDKYVSTPIYISVINLFFSYLCYFIFLYRIGMLQSDLKSSLENCEYAKNCLKLTKRRITTAGLGLLGNCHKRSLILDLLNSLNNMKMLVRYNTLINYSYFSIKYVYKF